MRCYLMREGHVEAVEFLESADDQGRVEEARRAFELKSRKFRADGFEVWDGARCVYRFPETPKL